MAEGEEIDPNGYLEAINPGMTAAEAIHCVKMFHDLNTVESQVDELRENQLRQNNENPDEWTYYSNWLGEKGKGFDPAFKELFEKRFPPDVEFLPLRGSFYGGITGREGSWGISLLHRVPDNWSIYIREKKKS